MVKKFKSLSEGQLTQTVKESAQQIWLAGLGAFAKAQEEGNKVFDALVKEGEAIQKKTRKMADEKFSVVRKTADEKFADVRKVADAKMAAVTGKAAGTWDRLEQVFEDRVARALSSLGVPTKKEIDKLSKRVAELTATVQKLNDGGEGVAKKVCQAGRQTRSQASCGEACRQTGHQGCGEACCQGCSSSRGHQSSCPQGSAGQEAGPDEKRRRQRSRAC